MRHSLSPSLPDALKLPLTESRQLSLDLAAPLSSEDMTVQAMDDASPTKWHLAHVTWFFETFLLSKYLPGYRVFDPAFQYCFNSYYESEGERHPRTQRGLLTRPSAERVLDYRAHVDDGLQALYAKGLGDDPDVARLVEIGINHEQQHQELMLTDILALFARNPLRPAYRTRSPRLVGASPATPDRMGFIVFDGGIHRIGHAGDGYAWDNESPQHNALLQPFGLADRLVTNAEWQDFISDGGYADPLLWLADGWAAVKQNAWRAPLYWEQRDSEWYSMTLEGLQLVEAAAPVVHVSYFEADAFARWSGKRLPTEFEWEVASARVPLAGNLLSSDRVIPLRAETARGELRQMFGDVWEWTQSAYLPYPGYRPPAGAIGEYNGKFMVSQHVLRGGSCATPAGHIRSTYRNFFYPHQRWQFMGLRLASEID